MRNVTPRPLAAAFTVVAAARGSRDDEDGSPTAAAMSRMTSSSNDLVVPRAEAAMVFRRRLVRTWSIEGSIARFALVQQSGGGPADTQAPALDS